MLRCGNVGCTALRYWGAGGSSSRWEGLVPDKGRGFGTALLSLLPACVLSHSMLDACFRFVDCVAGCAGVSAIMAESGCVPIYTCLPQHCLEEKAQQRVGFLAILWTVLDLFSRTCDVRSAYIPPRRSRHAPPVPPSPHELAPSFRPSHSSLD